MGTPLLVTPLTKYGLSNAGPRAVAHSLNMGYKEAAAS